MRERPPEVRSAAPVVIRPGPLFWCFHLFDGVLVLCLVQLLVVRFGPAAQAVAAALQALAFVAAGVRTEVRVDHGSITIRNPWRTKRMQVSEVGRLTPQRVRGVRGGSTNCLAVWVEGAQEGWPAIATLRGSADASFDRWSAVVEQVTRSIGQPVDDSVLNPPWRPGASRRRLVDRGIA